MIIFGTVVFRSRVVDPDFFGVPTIGRMTDTHRLADYRRWFFFLYTYLEVKGPVVMDGCMGIIILFLPMTRVEISVCPKLQRRKNTALYE